MTGEPVTNSDVFLWSLFELGGDEDFVDVEPVLSELRAFQARRQADSEAGPGLGDQLRHQG